MNIALRITDELPVCPAPRERAKPCPFCGNDELDLARRIASRFYVGCESDDCTVNPQTSGATVSEAWDNWNRRAR